MNKEHIAAVILAAGASSRMSGVKKELQKLQDDNLKDVNLTVLGSAVCAFAAVSSVKTIVIAVPQDGESAAREALPQKLFLDNSLKILFVNGGSSRRISVFNALSVLVPYNPCYVLIHDGARPWVSSRLIENIIDAVKKHDAVIPLLSITDTPKLITTSYEQLAIDKEQTVFIKTHLKRENIGVTQTPQAFKFPEILHAHEKAAAVEDEEFTDDAEVWGRFNGLVAAISGEPENKKITFPEDLYHE